MKNIHALKLLQTIFLICFSAIIMSKGAAAANIDYQFDNYNLISEFENNDNSNPYIDRHVWSIYKDEANDVLYLGTGGGLLIGTKNTSDNKYHFNTKYNEASGLPGNDVRSIAVDADGDIYIGIYGSGLSIGVKKDNHYDFKTYGRDDGLSGIYIASVKVDSNKTVYVTTKDNGGELFIGAKPRQGDRYQFEKQNLPRSKKYSAFIATLTNFVADTPLFIDPAGTTIYVGAMDGLIIGVKQGDKYLFKRYKTTDLIWDSFYKDKPSIFNQDNSVRSIAVDEEKTVYVGTENDFWVGTREGDAYKFKHKDEASNLRWLVNSIATNRGTVYAGTYHGLWVGTKNKDKLNFINLDFKHSGLISDTVRSVYADKKGAVYVGTDDGLSIVTTSSRGIYLKDEL